MSRFLKSRKANAPLTVQAKSARAPQTAKSAQTRKKSESKPHRLAKKKSSSSPSAGISEVQAQTIKNWLQLGQLRTEKCELPEARVAYRMALKQARRLGDIRSEIEAISSLLRLAGEALDEVEVTRLNAELDELLSKHSKSVPSLAWYCKSVVVYQRKNYLLAQRYLHRYIRAVRSERSRLDDEAYASALAKGWVKLAMILVVRDRFERARLLTDNLLKKYEPLNLHGINGMLYLVEGWIDERTRKFEAAFRWYQKAHGAFLGEHNWLHHLYVLYGYARLSRFQQKYAEAYWYLDLVEKATQGTEFGLLRREVTNERSRLEQDAIDLLIDSRQCLIRTKDDREISLGKQYVLLQILEALTHAHERIGDDRERGLSKAEIIQFVWNESYRPEAHDNKLYYNINRLRRLLEPDIKNPQYLLNWKEGYRLAPGLRIKFVGGRSRVRVDGSSTDFSGGKI